MVSVWRDELCPANGSPRPRHIGALAHVAQDSLEPMDAAGGGGVWQGGEADERRKSEATIHRITDLYSSRAYMAQLQGRLCCRVYSYET